MESPSSRVSTLAGSFRAVGRSGGPGPTDQRGRARSTRLSPTFACRRGAVFTASGQLDYLLAAIRDCSEHHYTVDPRRVNVGGMAISEGTPPTGLARPGLEREIGFIGLIWASEGSIIGSGWLFGAQGALSIAGPAAIISWAIGGAAILILALVHAELGGMYPVSGGTAPE